MRILDQIMQTARQAQPHGPPCQKGAAIGGILGGTAGGAVGALIGSEVFPGLGTVVGGFVGGYAGGVLGNYLGDRYLQPLVNKYYQPRASVWVPGLQPRSLPPLAPTPGGIYFTL